VSPWTTLADVRAAIRKKWDSGWLLTRYASGEPWEPLFTSVRGPAAREIGERLADVQRWAREWAAAPSMLRVEQKVVGGRQFGTNTIPARAWVDSYEDAWALMRTGREVRRFDALRDGTPERILPWLTAHPMRALKSADEWSTLLAVVRWIDERQVTGMYLRQVDVPGVDTKFIESHRGILGDLLEAQLPAARVAVAETDFTARFGFLKKPGYVRFRGPCGQKFSELTVRADEFRMVPGGARRVFVVENEITYLAFPLPPDAIVVWGRGYAVDVLGPLGWLADLDIVYWGDIDTHGFAILSRLRGTFPRVRSLLMDSATLLEHRSQWVTEPTPVAASLAGLTDAEAALYADLAAGTYGSAVRLEQERVNFSALSKALAGSDQRLASDLSARTGGRSVRPLGGRAAACRAQAVRASPSGRSARR